MMSEKMRSIQIQYGEAPSIQSGADENDPSRHTKNAIVTTRSNSLCTEPLEQRRASTENIRGFTSEKDEEFSFQKIRGKALELERRTIENALKTPTKNNIHGCIGSKQSMVESLKQKEDFSFDLLREKALKLEKRTQIETRLDDSSNRKGATRVECHKSIASSLDKSSSENSSPQPKRLQQSMRGKDSNAPNRLDVSSNRKGANLLEGHKPIVVSSNKSSLENSSPQPKRLEKSESGKESYTPNRLNKYYKQRIKREEVEATDMSHASVKKLSQWLAEKPFEKQKKPVVTRKGTHIVTKARVFEKDYFPTVVLEEVNQLEEINQQYFPSGKVSEAKQWLQKAFKNVDDNDETKSDSVSDKAKIFETVFKAKRRTNSMGVDTRALYGET